MSEKALATASTDLAQPDDKNVTDVEAMAVLPLKRELSFQDQSSRMPFRKLLVVYLSIGLALVIAFMDQTAVSTAAPVIASDLGGSSTMSWIGTSFFVANCAFQLIYGRLSDIFGRKNTLQVAVLLLALGNLLCSFAKTPIQLYIFRAISGAGGGGVTNIAMVIVSDIVPLKERGKYQGLITAATSLGTAIGPFVGGALASAGQWRWLFRVTAILGALVVTVNHFMIPLRPVTGSMKTKLAQIDYVGVVLSAAFTVFMLVPISGGGSTFAWHSPVVISLLVLGILCGVAFLLNEIYVANLPILPMRLFLSRTPCTVMAQSFLIGIILYGNIYYVPVFLQYVLGKSALVSGALVLAYNLPQAAWGVVAGLFVSRTNRYRLTIIVGGVLWAVGVGLQLLWSPESSLGMVIGILEITSIGTGFCLQTTLVAALATTESKDRAVVTGGRNFFRTLGAGFGLAISNTAYQTSAQRSFSGIPGLTAAERKSLADSALDTLAPGLVEPVRLAQSKALRSVFIFYTAVAGVCLLTAFLIKASRVRASIQPDLTVTTQEVTFRVDPIDHKSQATSMETSTASESLELEPSGTPLAEKVA